MPASRHIRRAALAPVGLQPYELGDTRSRSPKLTKERDRGRFAARILAELIIIIAGVMIALWADSRVAARASRSTEGARLEALQANVHTTAAELHDYDERLERARHALRVLLASSRPNARPAADTLRAAFVLGFLDVLSLQPQLDVYDDLRSSGELGLLDDPNLRRALSAMQAARQDLASAIDDLATVQQLNFDPYLIRNTDMLLLFPDSTNAAASAYPNWLAGVLSDREFRNLVVFKLDLIDVLDRAADRMDEAVGRADSAIDERLERLR